MAYATPPTHGALPAGSTAAGSVISATGFDRLVLLHIGTVSQQTVAFWNVGVSNVPYTTSLILAANDVRDLGPWLLGSTEALYGGGVTSSSGWYHLEELRP